MPNLKFGLKYPPIPDDRNIKLKSILRVAALPTLPETYDIHGALGVMDSYMFANNQCGCCGVAMKAHQTLCFEKFEQGSQPYITDQEVKDQYYIETGGPDVGVYLQDSLKTWRKDGWTAGGKHYDIHAFAEVDWLNHNEVRYCIYLLNGIDTGILLYQNDIDQFNANEPWHIESSKGVQVGGHGIYSFRYGAGGGTNPSTCSMTQAAVKYLNAALKIVHSRTSVPTPVRITAADENGLYCMTWGRPQFMTWDWWDDRVYQAFGVVDNVDKWLGNSSPLNIKKLDGYLNEITA
jgi:hypothetical protein